MILQSLYVLILKDESIIIYVLFSFQIFLDKYKALLEINKPILRVHY